MRKVLIILLFIPYILISQEKLSLEKCRQMALEHNQKVKIASEEEQTARMLRKATFTEFLPNFNFLGTYQRLSEKFLIRTPQIDLDLSNVNPTILPLVEPLSHVAPQDMRLGKLNNMIFNVSVFQPIFMGGKIRNLYKSAKEAEKMSKSNLVLEKSEIIAKTDEYYWKTVSMTEQFLLAKRNKETVERFRYDVENIHKEGIITKADLLKVKVKSNDAELKLLKATNGLKLYTMALCQVIGLPLNTQIVLTDTAIDVILTNTNENDTKKFLANRPEISMLENSLNISSNNVKMMFSRFLPDIGLTANANTMNPNPYNNMEQEFGFGWNVGITCAIPIFHWNNRGYTYRAAKHQKRISELKLDEAKELISLQIQQAIFKLEESAKKIELTAVSMSQSEENLKIITDNFKEGMSTTAEVLEAQTLWHQSYYDNIDAKAEYRINQTNYLKVTGKLLK